MSRSQKSRRPLEGAENTVKNRRVQLWRVLDQSVSVVGRGSAGLAADGVQVMYLTYLVNVLCVCCCAAALAHGCMRKCRPLRCHQAAIAGRIGVRCVLFHLPPAEECCLVRVLGIIGQGVHCTRHLLAVLHILHCPHYGELVDCIVASLWLAGSSRSEFLLLVFGTRCMLCWSSSSICSVYLDLSLKRCVS